MFFSRCYPYSLSPSYYVCMLCPSFTATPTPFPPDQINTTLEQLEIGGNAWESISGKKVIVHEFEGPTRIQGFSSKDIERVTTEETIERKIEALKVCRSARMRESELPF